jgi:glycosyltransferase involved in cell wall biosynthesis
MAEVLEQDLVRSSRIAVVFVIDGLRDDGAQKFLYLVCRGLDRERFQLSVIGLSHRRDKFSDFCRIGVPTTVLGIRYPWHIGRLFSLYRLLRNAHPTIANTVLSKSNVLGVIAAALARVPIIVASVRNNRPPPRWAHALWERLVFKLCDCVTVVSSSIGRLVVQEMSVPEHKVRLVVNGIDAGIPKRIVAHTDLPFALPQPEGYLVATVGRLHPQKGHRYLLEAAQRVVRIMPDAHFLIVGDGCLDGQLRERARRLGMADQVTFTGRLPHEVTLKIVSEVDLFVLPSLYEGMPNALLEAMALGRPVVASAVDGCMDVIVDGESGLLIPPSDIDSLAEAMIRLLRDDALRERLGRAARTRVESEFTVQRMVKRLTGIYEDLLSTRLGHRPGAAR